jgi:metallophosphoesterase (TIGR00282 family)
MRILICGDVVGRAGRKAVLDRLPGLRGDLDVDFVLLNGENAAGGFGITPDICDSFFAAGVDAITTGNHVWDQKAIIPHFETESRLLRPHNYAEDAPGTGIGVFPDRNGRKVLVLHFMARLFMPAVDDPFAGVEKALAQYRLGDDVAATVIDFHGEATSEKMALGHLVDGRASAVVGTHSHVPTADAQVFVGGTAYLTDLGMCGDYDSVIGMEKSISIKRFRGLVPLPRLEPAQGEATLCGALVETDDDTGLAISISPLRIGGRLAPHWPEF